MCAGHKRRMNEINIHETICCSNAIAVFDVRLRSNVVVVRSGRKEVEKIRKRRRRKKKKKKKEKVKKWE